MIYSEIMVTRYKKPTFPAGNEVLMAFVVIEFL